MSNTSEPCKKMHACTTVRMNQNFTYNVVRLPREAGKKGASSFIVWLYWGQGPRVSCAVERAPVATCRLCVRMDQNFAYSVVRCGEEAGSCTCWAVAGTMADCNGALMVPHPYFPAPTPLRARFIAGQ